MEKPIIFNGLKIPKRIFFDQRLSPYAKILFSVMLYLADGDGVLVDEDDHLERFVNAFLEGIPLEEIEEYLQHPTIH